MLWSTLILYAVLLLRPSKADSTVNHPDLAYSQFGGRLGILGDFDSLSVYSFANESDILASSSSSFSSSKEVVKRDNSTVSSSSSQNLYLRNTDDNTSKLLAAVNGPISYLAKYNDDVIILNGNFTTFKNQNIQPPLLYNVSSESVIQIFYPSSNNASSSSNPTISDGSVNAILIDQDLLYLGGDFTFNNTVGAAVYNVTADSVSSFPFKGFGKGASVNAIARVMQDNTNDDASKGSIIFGGSFDTLGFPELLIHNSTNSTKKNNTNNTYITAEQVVSLKNGVFSSINGADNNTDSSIICPSTADTWYALDGMGAQWKVSLPDPMKGIVPTKVRLYVPEGTDGTKLFRIYTYPNTGIMNLTYINPETNELETCDAWCPLWASSDLKSIASDNSANAANISSSSVFVEDNGSYTSYYDASNNTKTLGYGSNYQEFALINNVAFDSIGVTIIDWYGNRGALAGFQVFQTSISAYGNETLNEPNCANDDAYINSSEIVEGSFQAVTNITDSVTDNDYLVSYDTDAKMILYPNISYSGNYSIIMTTPGCLADNSCDFRSIVNVSVIDDNDRLLKTNIIYQNNDYEKFDYLYDGHLNGSSSDEGKSLNRIEISFNRAITEDADEHWFVVDKVTASLISLDEYLIRNSTNSTKSSSLLSYVRLNGLFEYSLDNFTDFNSSKVTYTMNNKTYLNPENSYVGNSSINLLSSRLTSDSEVNEFIQQLTSLLARGSFKVNESDVSALTLLNSNLITIALGSFNTTSNSTNVQLIHKRADSNIIYGALFDSSVSLLVKYANGVMMLGEFTLTNNGNSSIQLIDMLTNKSVSSINNFVLYDDDVWYGFGNTLLQADSFQFTNLTYNGIDYCIFTLDDNDYRTWDNTNKEWVTDGQTFNISHALSLRSNQQILGGSSFTTMEFYEVDQAYMDNLQNFSSYNLNISSGAVGALLTSYYLNTSLSVIGGRFNATGVQNLAFISNNGTGAISLSGSLEWPSDTSVISLYADTKNQYLFIGTNGTVSSNSDQFSGLFIYDLTNNTLASFQPAMLSSSNDDGMVVNAVALSELKNQILVGGVFDQAGSLSCEGLCIYDLVNTRWDNPLANNGSFSGSVTDMKFYSSSEVLVSGNFTINSNQVNFITYNFDSSDILPATSLNYLGSDFVVKKFVTNDNELNGRLIAYGDNFISGFNGTNWTNIDDSIIYDSETEFTDIKLLYLDKSNTASDEEFFDKDKILALTGKFQLRDYGSVNVALFNGTDWIPYIFTADSLNKLGVVNSLLIMDSFSFQSSADLKKKLLSRGKVVGISLACALGSTTLLGLLYLIPFLLLLRKKKDDNEERIHEKDMMDAVNPEDLIYEMDLQKGEKA